MLGSLFDSIEASRPDFVYEILLVDNASSDDTREVALAIRDQRTAPLTYVLESTPGLSVARNTGVRAARHEIVAIVDDDLYFEPGWLTHIAAPFRESADVACVAGKILPLFEAGRPAWSTDDLVAVWATRFGEVRRTIQYPEHPYGANMAVRKSVYEALGGFDMRLGRKPGGLRSNEEPEFSFRLHRAGLTIVYEPAAVVHHRVSANMARPEWICSRFYWQGISDAIMERIVARRSRASLLKDGMAELLAVARDARGGHLSPRRIRWRLHGLRVDTRAHYAYRLGRARQQLLLALTAG
jgi:glycosyltransferase involved in cell wall biosynthesis